jgi:molybdopterin-binding protein
MNKIHAKVKEIQTEQNLTIVSFAFGAYTLKMMSLELESSVQVGSEVILTSKATSLGLAKDFQGVLSYSNILKATISELQNGVLLSSVKLACEDLLLESIITKDSALRMDLCVGDELNVLIKASELSILEVL